jgi:Cys-tRNA(Pro) deacylase
MRFFSGPGILIVDELGYLPMPAQDAAALSQVRVPIAQSIWQNAPMEENPALEDPRLTGVDHEVIRHGKVTSLEEAAELRGVDPSAVIKTMVVRKTEEDYVFALVPGDRMIDWAKLRNILGQRRLSMPDADEALDVTGYVRGTITPFGATRPWPVVADDRLLGTMVSIGGGAPGVSITIDGTTLIATLGATAADIAKQRS